MKARLTALAISCSALAGCLGAPEALAWLALALPGLAVLLGPRLKVGLVGESAASLAAAFVGVLSVRLLLPIPYRHDVSMLSERELLFMLPLLMVAGVRALLKTPRFGSSLTLALGLMALTSAGGALTGPWFPVLAASFGIFGLSALAANDAQRKLQLRPAGIAALLVIGLLAGGFAVSSSVLAPRLHAKLMSKIQERMRSAHVGFSSNLELGDLHDMLLDSRVVLRLRGNTPPALIRGAAFNEYREGRWFSKRHTDLRTVARVLPLSTDAPQVGDSGWYELEHSTRPERYFLPHGATHITTSAASYTKDEFGIVYPPDDSYAKRVWFQVDGSEAPRPPDPEDLHVPEPLKGPLSSVLNDWHIHGSREQRLHRIQSRLGSFRYALTSERETRGDPLIDFLLYNQVGHCEYFASAMVLLSRSVGVPARLVAGYRVVESSPFGYRIVRRQHAHAWVEAWLGNRWVTFDPTPTAELESTTPRTTPWLAAVADATRTAWAAVDDWLERRTTFELALALLALGAAFIVLRTLRARSDVQVAHNIGDKPLPGFLALDQRLAKHGLARMPTETVAHYARRLGDTPELSEQQREQVVALLEAYEVLRYAGRGDAATLDHSLADLSRSL